MSKGTTTTERASYLKALDLLERADACFSDMEKAPDANWYREYLELAGRHAILTEEGWEPGDMKAQYLENPEYGPEYILDEVCAPEGDGA
jgi:hypothetical protein